MYGENSKRPREGQSGPTDRRMRARTDDNNIPVVTGYGGHRDADYGRGRGRGVAQGNLRGVGRVRSRSRRGGRGFAPGNGRGFDRGGSQRRSYNRQNYENDYPAEPHYYQGGRGRGGDDAGGRYQSHYGHRHYDQQGGHGRSYNDDHENRRSRSYTETSSRNDRYPANSADSQGNIEEITIPDDAIDDNDPIDLINEQTQPINPGNDNGVIEALKIKIGEQDKTFQDLAKRNVDLIIKIEGLAKKNAELEKITPKKSTRN